MKRSQVRFITKPKARHRYGLIPGAIDPKPGQRFISDRDGLTVINPDGSVERFDSEGRLISIDGVSIVRRTEVWREG